MWHLPIEPIAAAVTLAVKLKASLFLLIKPNSLANTPTF
jgi:hypothetical protein